MSIFDSDIQQAYWEKRRSIWDAIKDIKVIDKLKDSFSGRHVILDDKQGLEELVGKAQIIVVNGAYFGDEGKGKWTDVLASLYENVEAIFRANSSDNAAHTVKSNGISITCHVTPSAITTGKECYIGPEVVFDPVRFVQDELEELVRNEISYDNLKIGNSHIITPYHRIMDIVGSKSNTSTWSGVAPAHASKAKRQCPRLDDLFGTEEHQKKVFERDLEEYKGFLAAKGTDEDKLLKRLEEINDTREEPLPDYLVDFVKAKDKTEFLINLYKEHVTENKAFPEMVDVEHIANKYLEEGKTIVVESPQSKLLSNGTQQFFNFGTSANTSASGVLASLNINIQEYKFKVLNVLKFPGPSRVGAGNIPASFTEQDRFSREGIDHFKKLGNACTDFDAIQELYFNNIGENGILEPVTYEDETGEYMITEAMAISASRNYGEIGGTSKKPRIVGLFDCVLGAMVNESQGPYLAISAMDRGDYSDKVGLTVGYVVHLPEDKIFKEDKKGKYIYSKGKKYRSGEIIKAGDQVPCANVLNYCHSITKVMDGWKDTPIAADQGKLGRDEELPANVSNVIEAIEHYTGFEVRAIGVGPDREDYYFIKDHKRLGVCEKAKMHLRALFK
jgi:adenylosuccinate synthase